MLEALQGGHRQQNLCRQVVLFMTMGWKTGDTNFTTRFTTGSKCLNLASMRLTVPGLVLRYWYWIQKCILTQNQVLVRACQIAHSSQFIGWNSRLVGKCFVTVVKRNGQLVKLEFCQSVVRLFVYHSSRRWDKVGHYNLLLALIRDTVGSWNYMPEGSL